ncbi:MAG: 16S rRNA (guanine(527)-N(7))-methyltransferase RsmG [Chloroflexi bacterium]|nr:16S rRNA (guanine(527)-N(7))-methyltransferase RsmG [Chloroflexota bacterium]
MEKLIAGARKLWLELTPQQLQQFHTYYQEMMDWNKRVNLTSITAFEDVQVKHFLDSLTVVLAWEQLPQGAAFRMMDVGAGAGLPGIPLKIMFPGIKLALLEATGKKVAFLQYITQKLGLDNVEVVAARAEEAAHDPQYRERFDVALSRAVAEMPALAELTLPFCAIGGMVIAQKKGDIAQEVSQAAKAIETMGGKLREMKRIEIKELADDRWLVIIEKTSPTPPQYPRRSGMPAKRPILDKPSKP